MARKRPSPKAPSPARRADKRADVERSPLTRDRVLRAAMALADDRGMDALTMRAVAETLHVEAMALYRHVKNKDDLLDGLVELVFAEMLVPMAGMPWREAVRMRAASARAVILRHRWAALLVESRLASGPMRLRHHEAVLRTLRQGGFSVPLAYAAYMTMDSYIYGFVMQEVAWPFEPSERPAIAEKMAPLFSHTEHANILEVLAFSMARETGTPAGQAYDEDFAFGLELILNGLESARDAANAHPPVRQG